MGTLVWKGSQILYHTNVIVNVYSDQSWVYIFYWSRVSYILIKALKGIVCHRIPHNLQNIYCVKCVIWNSRVVRSMMCVEERINNCSQCVNIPTIKYYLSIQSVEVNVRHISEYKSYTTLSIQLSHRPEIGVIGLLPRWPPLPVIYVYV